MTIPLDNALQQNVARDASSVLLADVGGTNCRFALAMPGGRPERALNISNRQAPDFASAVQQYLEATGAYPRAATIAVAGPVAECDDKIALTNHHWFFYRSELARRFGFDHVEVLNDFEAIAWSLGRLGRNDQRPIGKAPAGRNGARIVLGPGTGLGVAALIPRGETWHVVSSEGGHVSFGALGAQEAGIFQTLSNERGFVSAETILSGPGLVRLARALAPNDAPPTSEGILAAARSGERLASFAVRLFVRFLGRFAGDMALTFKATGGVYLSGGVACGLGPLLETDLFRSAFEAHPPHETMLAQIATSLIVCPEPGLLGCAAHAAVHDGCAKSAM
jgi:glucokinase